MSTTTPPETPPATPPKTPPAFDPKMTYQIDPMHSTARFSVRHMMISRVHGDFSKLTGTLVFDPSNIEASQVNVTINVNTVDTKQPDRDTT